MPGRVLPTKPNLANTSEFGVTQTASCLTVEKLEVALFPETQEMERMERSRDKVFCDV